MNYNTEVSKDFVDNLLGPKVRSRSPKELRKKPHQLKKMLRKSKKIKSHLVMTIYKLSLRI